MLLLCEALAATLLDSTAQRGQNGQLTTRTHGYFRQLRFSSNGRYILAQNDSTISILAAQPLGLLFQLSANDTSLAEFAPDSATFSFIRSESALKADPQLLNEMGYQARVERWNIADRSHLEFAPLTLRACGTYELSPDGRTFACVDEQGTLSITDVESRTRLFEKERFGKTDYVAYGYGIPFPTRTVGDPGSARMDFSPDGRFLIVNPWWAIGHTVTYDIWKQTMVTPKGRLKKGIQRYFAFITPCSILLGAVGSRGLLVDFPSGRALLKPKIPMGLIYRAADPSFIINRPWGYHVLNDDPNATKAAAVNIETGKIILSERPGLDVYRNFYVAEPNTNEIGLYEIGRGISARIRLSDSGNP